MNNFNAIFTAIKSHCGGTDAIVDKKCLDDVCYVANIPLNKIEPYLNLLHHFGFINYSTNKHSIQLTPLGKQQERLFDFQEVVLVDKFWRRSVK